MKLPISWLKDYVDVDVSADELMDKLSMAGLEIEAVEKTAGTHVFDIEITSNRPDWLSILGIAQEVSALYDNKLHIPFKINDSLEKLKNVVKDKIDFSIKIENKQACPRYTAHIIRNVKIGPSPKWLSQKLEAMGLRPINNVVDITNFVLFEFGQPLHAFDLDTLKDNKIIVRNAKDKEKITLIGEIEKKLSAEDLVIADGKRAIAIAGVMGGEHTQVTEKTTNILLESAFFDPIITRRTARRLGISTDSSYRFERTVNARFVIPAALRALELIRESAGGEIISQYFDAGAKKSKEHKVIFRPHKAQHLLGVKIPLKNIESILKNLGFTISKKGPDKVEVIVPSFRRDIQREADIIEEIIRIWGYDNIPMSIPKSVHQTEPLYPFKYIINNRVKNLLVDIGFYETLTYSLMNKDVFLPGFSNDKDIVCVQNPLSREQEVMRCSLIPGMLAQIARNLNKGSEDLRLFECSRIYYYDKKYPGESTSLCIGMCGMRYNNWQDKQKPVDYYDLKGAVEFLMNELGIKSYKFKVCDDSCSNEKKIYAYYACLNVNGKCVGTLGEIKSEILSSYDIDKHIFIADINLENIYPHVNLEKKYEEPPRFPSVVRDIAVLVSKNTLSSDVINEIWKAAPDLVIDVKLFDQYTGKNIPDDKKSLAYSITFNSKERSLTDEEVNQMHKNIQDAIVKKFNAVIR